MARTVHVLALAILVTSFAPRLSAEAPTEKPKVEDGFTAMFNGRDLSGWEGAEGWWEVRDGVLTAESTAAKPCTRSHYLYWKGGEPADFDLRFMYRISGQANSGVQFRSERRPNWDTWGYQADVDHTGTYTGCLYQHGRGLAAKRGQSVVINEKGEKKIKDIGNFDELLKQVKPDWNEYRVAAEGPKLRLWINGTLMCEVEDHEPKYALKKGIIALQMHQGPPMKAEFKNLRIKVK